MNTPMAGRSLNRPCHSDSFGGSTSVKIHISTRQASLAKVGAVLSSLVILPLVPLAGAVLGSIARKQISKNASLSGKRRATYAVRMGTAAVCAQVIATAGYAFAVWTSIENASSLVGSQTLLTSSTDDAASIKVRPEFKLHQFMPGATRPFRVESGEQVSSVQVRFDSMPSWSASGPIFDATIVDRTAGLANHTD